MKKLLYLFIVICISHLAKAQTALVSTGTGSAYLLSYPAAFLYSSGITVTFKAHVASAAGPVTLNINSLGAKTIKKNVTSDLALGDIMLNQFITVIYDGTNFQLTSPASTAGNSSWDLDGNVLGAVKNIGTKSNHDFPFITNAIERMRIDALGNIGIGTSAPTEKVHVLSADSDIDLETVHVIESSSLHIKRASGTIVAPAIVPNGQYLGGIGFKGYDGASYQEAARVQASIDGTTGLNDIPGRLEFWTTSVGTNTAIERMRIDNAGNVGIGITTPGKLTGSTRYLSVAGTQTGLSNGTASLELIGNTASYNTIASKIDFLGLAPVTNAASQRARIEAQSGASQTLAGQLTFWTNNGTNTASIYERMRITEGGNIGIGTSTPTAKLDIRDLNITTGSTTTGNLNIMTTDPQAIDVGGSLTLGGFNDNAATAIRVFGSVEGRKESAATGSSTGYLLFKTNSAGTLYERMRITGAGNVGIGTSAPTAKLEVVGDIRIPAANNYTYATPKTHTYSIGLYGWFKRNEATTEKIYPSTNYIYMNGGTNIAAYAMYPFHLPDNAIITNVEVRCYDNHNTFDVHPALTKTALSNGAFSIQSLPTTSGQSTVIQTISSGAISYPIDNANFAYYMQVGLYDNSMDTRVYSVKITYTVLEAD